MILFLNLLWKKFTKKLSYFCSFFVLFFLSCYQAFISGTLGSGGACRFYPSCSTYAFLIYKKYSFVKASGLVLKRLMDCQPFGPKTRYEPELIEKDKIF